MGVKKISVVIPTFNEEKYIERLLISLCNQTIPREDYEIIIVDGGSTDRTIEICRKYADKIVMQETPTVGGARNNGVKYAEAELVFTTDADCIVTPNLLERIINIFNNNPQVVMIYGVVTPLERRFRYAFLLELNNAFVKILYRLRIYLSVGSIIAFRKHHFEMVKGFPTVGAGDDYGFSFRMRRVGEVMLDETLRVYFSMRRYEKYGFAKSFYEWLYNVFSELLKRRIPPEKLYHRKAY
ncbi:MAG: glycosyltransferase family A protein [Nitrososphaerota archaeon]|nr:glycosyltransferase family A protein [Nitrososphaerota archaeon]